MTKTFEQLLEHFLRDELSPEECKLFLTAVKQTDNEGTIKEKLYQKLESKAYTGSAEAVDMEMKFQQMLQKADRIKKSQEATNVTELYSPNKIFNLRRIAVAASILLVIGLSAYFLFFINPANQDEIVKTTVNGDIQAPVINRSMITLSNGQRVYLDSAVNGTLAMQNNIKLVKLANGQIAYETASGEIIKEIKYNTLENPRGSKVIDIQLSDGSHVWVNAGSTVTYPIVFVGNERKVSITGEAYFEVAHDPNKPFYVSNGGVQVQVLGTHFNVNAYHDEADIKITLLEGSVNVSKGNVNSLLKPGQQAQVNGNIEVTNDIDVEEIMAWKNGRFEFRGTSIRNIMKQVERWYDVEVVYEGKIPTEEFMGATSRQENISALLKVFEATGKIHFRIEGKRVVVME